MLVGAVASFHVADFRLLPRRWQLAAHLGATGGALLAARWSGLDDEALGLDRARWPHGAVAGLLVAVGVGAGVTGLVALPAASPMFDDARVAAASRGQVVFRALVEIPLATAVYEEVLFRGVLLGEARRHLSQPAAVAVTSALFGLWHVLPALESHEDRPVASRQPKAAVVAVTVVATSVAGACFALLRLRTRSLLAPVLAHTATNVIPLIAARWRHERSVAACGAAGEAPSEVRSRVGGVP